MIITTDFLKSKNACSDGYDRFVRLYGKSAELSKVIKGHIKDSTLNYANWLITKVMTPEQCVRYAIFAAEQVLYIFENKYPNDNRPRKAIEAAKNYLCNKSYAADAADAAYAAYAADAADAYAADAARDAAWKEMKIKILKYGLQIIKK